MSHTALEPKRLGEKITTAGSVQSAVFDIKLVTGRVFASCPDTWVGDEKPILASTSRYAGISDYSLDDAVDSRHILVWTGSQKL